MVKLLITDVDGTLMAQTESRVSEGIKKQLRAFLASGGELAIASGRTYSSLMTLFGDMAEDVYFAPCDGALCIKNGKTLYHRPVSNENVRRAIAIAKERGLGLHLAAADHGYAFGGVDFEEKLTADHTEDFIRANNISDVRDPIYKIAFYGKAPNFETVPVDLRFSYRANDWCEYVYRYVDKGTVLSDLCGRLYMSKFDVAALGDGMNDVSMLKGAKYAFALKESVAEASGAALRANAAQALDEILKLRSDKHTLV